MGTRMGFKADGCDRMGLREDPGVVGVRGGEMNDALESPAAAAAAPAAVVAEKDAIPPSSSLPKFVNTLAR